MPDHTNPGTTNPANQAFPAPLPPPAPHAPASTAAKSSTGEMQIPRLHTTKAPPSAILGLPVEIHAGSASQVKPQPAEVAETRPPAKNIDAGKSRPGGLPVNVTIR